MKRAILVGTGTIAGVAAVLALNPDAATTTTASSAKSSVSSGTGAGSSSGSSSSGTSSSGSSSSGTSTSASTSGSDGTYTGDVVDVGNNYGNVQVEITVTGGRIVDVQALEVPQNDPRSSQISSVAIPYLVDQAITAQSSNVAGVSGASYTSYGFAQSLKSALAQAGLA